MSKQSRQAFPGSALFLSLVFGLANSSAVTAREQCEYQDFTAIGTITAIENERVEFTLIPQGKKVYPIKNQHARFYAEIDLARYPRLVAKPGMYHRLRLRTLTRGSCTPYYVLAASAARLEDVTATARPTTTANKNDRSLAALFTHAMQCSQQYKQQKNSKDPAPCLSHYAEMRSRSSQRQLGKWLNQITLLSIEQCNSSEEKLAARQLIRLPNIPHTKLCAHYQEGPFHKTAVVVFGRKETSWKIIALQEL